MVVFESTHRRNNNNNNNNYSYIQTTPPPTATTTAKRLTEAIRLVTDLIQRSVSSTTRRKISESKKTLGRSFSDLVVRHNAALGCSSQDVSSSFVSPRDYEFSCTSSPPRRRSRPQPRRRTHHRRRISVSAAPLSQVSFQSELETPEKEFHVDRAAEEFIERFYRDLLIQKWSAASRDNSDRFG